MFFLSHIFLSLPDNLLLQHFPCRQRLDPITLGTGETPLALLDPRPAWVRPEPAPFGAHQLGLLAQTLRSLATGSRTVPSGASLSFPRHRETFADSELGQNHAEPRGSVSFLPRDSLLQLAAPTTKPPDRRPTSSDLPRNTFGWVDPSCSTPLVAPIQLVNCDQFWVIWAVVGFLYVTSCYVWSL